MPRACTLALGIALALIPLFPALIALAPATVPGVSLLPPAAVLVLLAIAAACVAVWSTALIVLPRSPVPLIVPLAAAPAAGAVAALLGRDPLGGALFVAIAGAGVVWYATIVRCAREPRALDALLRTFVVSGTLASALAIGLLAARVPAALYTISHARATGTFVVPGELAGYLIVFIPIAFALARRGGAFAPFAWCGSALGTAAFALTFSRAGWAGLTAALAMLAVARRGRLRYAAAVAGAAIALLALAFNAHHDPSENFTRLSIWEAALQSIARFPFSGVGPFGFAHVYPLVRAPGAEPSAFHAHDIVLTVAAEAGLLGVAALAWGWWRFAGELRARLTSQGARTDVALAIASGLLGTWVQGLIDTSSVVIFALWPAMMGLAIACAGGDAPAVRRVRSRIAVASAGAALALLVLLPVQLASDSLASRIAVEGSLWRRLPPTFGVRVDTFLAAVIPLPPLATMLADDALQRGDAVTAAAWIARMPPGARRDDRRARMAAASGDEATAIAYYLDAGDDEALQHIVDQRVQRGRLHDADALERRIRDRLAQTPTRPNALGDAWWRLGRLAARLDRPAEAAADLDRASALAPLNTKYLLDGAQLALERGDLEAASSRFMRAAQIDPGDADAVAGAGLVALARGDVGSARAAGRRSDRIDPSAPLARRLRERLAAAR